MIIIDSIQNVEIKNESGKTIMSINNPNIEIDGVKYNQKAKDEKGNVILVDEYRGEENK